MVFEPLRIATDNLRTTGSFQIFEIHQRLPTCLHPQRVSVAFGKSVYEVDAGIQDFHPKDGIIVKGLQVSCFIELYQFGYNRFLFRILGNAFRFLQPIYYLFDGLTVQAPHFPHFLLNLAVLFHQAAVQPVRNRCFIFRIFHRVVKSLGFLLRHSVIIITCRSQHQILTGSLVHTLRHYLRVEDNGSDFFIKLFHRLSFRQRKRGCIHAQKGLFEEFGSKARHKLLAAIMMMNTVGEPYPFQIHFHGLEICRSLVTGIARIDSFQHPADPEVILPVLVKQDVTSLQSGFREVIN